MIIAAANMLVMAALAFLLWKNNRLPLQNLFWPALALKLGAGISLGMLYTHYYTIGDTFHYLDDGVAIARLARTDIAEYVRFLWHGDTTYPLWHILEFQEPRALFLSKIISVLSLLANDNYWLVSAYFSLAAFAGAWRLAVVLGVLGTRVQIVGMVALLFFPSIVFWTSGVIKESLAMGFLYFLVAVFLKVWFNERTRIGEWILACMATWALWNLKYYYLAVLLPVVATALVMKILILPHVTFRKPWMVLPVWLIVFLVPLFAASLVHPNFYPERFLDVIYENYQAYTELSKPGDMVRFDALKPEAGSVVMYIPKALLSGLFRPFVWEGGNILKMMAATENFFLLLLVITALPAWHSFFRGRHRLLIFSLAVYTVILCVFLTLSTPNFGTLARFRVGFLPFLLILVGNANPFVQRIINFTQR